MGGSGSKFPAKESARIVLAARNKLQSDQASAVVAAVSAPPSSSSAVASATSTGSGLSGRAPASVSSASSIATKHTVKMEDFMEPTILKEMSSWAGNLKSDVDAKALELRNSETSNAMATVIRFKQEREQVDKFGKMLKEVAGKLTEEQLMAVYTKAKDGKGQVTSKLLAEEFKVSPQTVEAMLKVARAPTIVAKMDKANKTNLNELKIAV